MSLLGTNIIEEWLKAEEAAAPDCKVLIAIEECTNGRKLDETALLKKLKGLILEKEGSDNAAR